MYSWAFHRHGQAGAAPLRDLRTGLLADCLSTPLSRRDQPLDLDSLLRTPGALANSAAILGGAAGSNAEDFQLTDLLFTGSPLPMTPGHRAVMAAVSSLQPGNTDLSALMCNEALEAEGPRSASKRFAQRSSPVSIRPSPNRGHLSPHVVRFLLFFAMYGFAICSCH